MSIPIEVAALLLATEAIARSDAARAARLPREHAGLTAELPRLVFGWHPPRCECRECKR